MKNKNRIVFFNILSTVILQGLAFITAPIFSRVLGTDNFGIVSVYTTWCLLFSYVFSLDTASTLNVARLNFPIEEKESYQSSVLSLGAVLHLIFGAIVLILLKPLAKLMKMHELLIVLLVVHSFGKFCLSMLNNKFTFEFQADKNCALSIFNTVCNMGLSLALIYVFPEENNYWGRVLGLVGSHVIITVFACIFFYRKSRTLFNWKYWKFAICLGAPIVLHSVSNLIMGQSDKVMLQHMTNDSVVGIYSLAASFCMVIHLIWTALNNSWSPFYHEYTKNGEIETMKHHARNYIELYTVLASGFVLLSNEVFRVFASKEYWDGLQILPLFSVGYYFVFLYSFPVNFEFFQKKTGIIAVVTASAALVNIGLNLVFIKTMGFVGAALATCISHVFQFLFHYFSARFIIARGEFPFRLRFFAPWLALFLVFAVMAVLTPDLWYLRWPIGAVLGVFELLRILKRKTIF